MKAYFLVAGYATRLGSLARQRPKPLLEVAGEPILTRIARRIFEPGLVREAVVVSNHRFVESFRDWSHELHARVPIRVLDDGSTENANRLGAIRDLAFALEQAPPAGDFLVVAGDNLIEFDLRPAFACFTRQHRPLLLLREVKPGAGPSPYNEVTLDVQGRVVRFREKPPDPHTNLAAIALYFFPRSVAPRVVRYLETGGRPDAPGHFVAWLVEQTEVRGLRFAGEWHDIGGPEHLAAARARLGGPAPAVHPRRVQGR